MNTQRPPQRELIIDCLSNRLWETSPEIIAQVLRQLPDDALNNLARATVQTIEPLQVPAISENLLYPLETPQIFEVRSL
ncbi:hypothetical protein NDI37_21980 [Funiculus sociatus GB2-A5]|uniref:Uncharacterized protein n=1 Tax=Funiculus sociatus GB2-A5 TaxID=2933946 RepID=A0ABV0JUK0_9CYAN|nr:MULTISPECIES: hypothetical protein [unclassified Trichocoleus]MBD2006485.1 hypothetical protein [Trichocoleus sp. FACHB-40]MBD2060766.1 hypothetical protein [Trichocoleus sp. FACHB-6]